jgi:hypothetical protein
MKSWSFTIISFTLIFTALFSHLKINAQSVKVTDTVIMGTYYTDEVYYSMADSKALISPRNTWDIAFRTTTRSSGILTNDGARVINFNKEKLLSFGINEKNNSGLGLTVFPDPAKDHFNVIVSGNTGEEIKIVLSDLSGRQLGADHPGRLETGLYQFRFDVTGLSPGIYLVTAASSSS